MNVLFESLGLARPGIAPLTRPALPASSGQGTPATNYGVTSPTVWLPRMEVLQRPNALVVRAELPGLKPDEINVSAEDGLLTIWGERRQEDREEREGFVRTERRYGTFYRTFPLPEDADEEHISATFRDGVLEITVPTSGRKRGQRIKVKS